jgi:hypothetical protein
MTGPYQDEIARMPASVRGMRTPTIALHVWLARVVEGQELFPAVALLLQ